MDIYVIFMILLVLATVVGPIAMMRPNPTQRRHERLRRYAREVGLSVKLLPPPALATDTAAPVSVPVYSLALQTQQTRWTLMRAPYTHESHLGDWWQFVGAKPTAAVQERIKSVLDKLPKGVSGLRSGGQQVAIFWREAGEEEDIDQLLQCLRQLGS